MNLELSDDQVMLKDSLSRALSKLCTQAHLRATEAKGHDEQGFALFHELGMTLLRVPEEAGGVGAGLFDAIIVAETLGEYLPVFPSIEAMVAGRLLAAVGATERLNAHLDGAILLFALHDAAQHPRQCVSHAAAADGIIFRVADQLRFLSGPFESDGQDIGGLGAREISFTAEQGEVLAQGAEAIDAYRAAVDEWKLLNAARIAATGRKAITDAAAYARERQAFGQIIGSFQGLAHPMADRLVDVEGAGLIVWRAAEAIANGEPGAAATINLASWWAWHAAQPATVLGMRVLGGYGATMEYDAQICFRRVTQWSLQAGDPDQDLQLAADRLWDDAAAPLPDAGPVPISFAFPAHAQALAAEARAIFEKHVTDERRRWTFFSDDFHDEELFRKLGAEGLLFPDLPPEHGGRGADSLSVAAVRGVYVEFGWNDTVVAVAEILAKLVLDHGSERAKAELLLPLARGEIYNALGYSEPSCGSDLFAVRTRAVRDGDDWVIDGQKMFTSQGHMADYALMVTRTGEDKHRGITLFALPLDQPGYRCDPIETIGGERTNTTFYEAMRVSDDFRLGEVDGGGRVLAQALAKEQGSMEIFIGALREKLEGGLGWARQAGRLNDPHVRAALARTAAHIQVIEALNARSLWAFAAGRAQKHFGPSGKLFGSEAMIRCGTELMAMAAPDSLFGGLTPEGRIEREYRRSIAATIYMGTSEVQRSIIAEAGLQLPRTRN